MNNYPRKILGYKTANELVLEITNNSLGVLIESFRNMSYNPPLIKQDRFILTKLEIMVYIRNIVIMVSHELPAAGIMVFGWCLLEN